MVNWLWSLRAFFADPIAWRRAPNLRQTSGRAKWNCCVARDWQKITPGPGTSGIDERSSQIGRRLHKWSMCLKQIKVRSGACIEKQEMSRGITGCMTQCRSELGHETVDNAPRPRSVPFSSHLYERAMKAWRPSPSLTLLGDVCVHTWNAFSGKSFLRFRPFPGLGCLTNGIGTDVEPATRTQVVKQSKLETRGAKPNTQGRTLHPSANSTRYLPLSGARDPRHTGSSNASALSKFFSAERSTATTASMSGRFASGTILENFEYD